MLRFRIYGKEGNKFCKLFWASQGKQKDIQYGSHFTSGVGYTSIHKDGQVHTTHREKSDASHHNIVQRPWTLDSLEYLDFIHSGGLAKDTIRKIALTKSIPKDKDLYILDLSEYDEELNYWIYVVNPYYLDETISQMSKLFPKMCFAHPQGWNPTILVCIFDPNKCDYGTKINFKAKENTVIMRMPKEFKLTYQIRKQ